MKSLFQNRIIAQIIIQVVAQIIIKVVTRTAQGYQGEDFSAAIFSALFCIAFFLAGVIIGLAGDKSRRGQWILGAFLSLLLGAGMCLGTM